MEVFTLMSDKNNSALPEYSVSMSVYRKERPDFLEKSLDSMFSQTHPCSELILACDGELTPQLDGVIGGFEKKFPDKLRVLRLNNAPGVGGCANAVIDAAKSGYIVKMDSDDIALPDRCEKQLRFMAENCGIDMCGAFIEEFDSDTGERIAVKRTPLTYEEIYNYAKRRNPFNNQTLVYKKDAAVRAGGYDTVKRCEDYDFVVKLLRSGAKGANIPEVLVRYRVTAENLKRRKNAKNTRSFISVRWRIYRSGFSSFKDFFIPCAAQTALFLLPGSLTGKLYKKFLRD